MSEFPPKPVVESETAERMPDLEADALHKNPQAEEGLADLTKEAKRILDELDTQTLGNLFEKERMQSGVIVERPTTSVFFSDIEAYGNHLDGVITLNPRLIKELAEKKGIPFRQALISVYVHESTHAEASNSVTHPTPLTLAKSLFSKQPMSESGYSRLEVQRIFFKRSFNLFNEGVTDSIASEVFGSYGSQTGDGSLREDSFASVYLEQRALLESFIALIAHKTDVPRDAVWGSIKQGYFQGLDLENSEMAQLYNELALTKVVEALGKLSSGTDSETDTRELAERMRLSIDDPLPQESIDRIEAYLTAHPADS